MIIGTYSGNQLRQCFSFEDMDGIRMSLLYVVLLLKYMEMMWANKFLYCHGKKVALINDNSYDVLHNEDALLAHI